MNNYQSYRTKKDTLSFTVFTAFIFPLFCDITTRYHFAVCSFLRRHVISAQTKPREYLTGNDQSQRTYYSVYFIQFIISLFYIFICFNNFVFMVFLIYTFIYIFYLSRRIMQISNHFNTWDWARDVLVPGLFEDGKYFTLNSSSPYIGNGDAVLVGMPRLRAKSQRRYF